VTEYVEIKAFWLIPFNKLLHGRGVLRFSISWKSISTPPKPESWLIFPQLNDITDPHPLSPTGNVTHAYFESDLTGLSDPF
jgi:hypothetical protein